MINIKLLFIEDNENDVLLTIRKLKKKFIIDKYNFVDNKDDLIQKLSENKWDLILCDYSIPGFNAPDALNIFKSFNIDIPFIILSGAIGEESAIDIMKSGAADVILKNNLSRLFPVIERELKEAKIRHKNKIIENENKKLKLAVEQSPVLIIITDPEGYIEYVNPKFEKVTGYTFQEIKNKKPSILKTGYTSKNEYNKLWKNILSGKEWKGEFKNKKKNGETYWETAAISPILDENGSIKNFIGIKEDITEKKELEQKLIHSEKLSAVGQLAAGVAHEFNNILGLIRLNAQALLYSDGFNINPELNSEFIESLKTIDEQTKRGEQIVSNMMTFSAINNPKKQVCYIQDIIEKVIKIQKKQFTLENIKILTDLQKTNPVNIDSGQMQQVFLNLTINARHAMNEQDNGILKISVYEKNNLIHIMFKDNGKRIFTPFFSTKGAHAKNNSKIKGTGLGLSVTHNIITSHKGSITVDSEPNIGTTFKIGLPVYLKENVNIETPEKKIGITHNYDKTKKFLIVDDEKQITDILFKVLKLLKFNNIVVSNDSKKVIELIKNESFDLIFMDILMPKIDGKQLVRQIREFNKNIPIIIVSGTLELEQKVTEGLDIQGFIKKPFDIEDIFNIIKQNT
jgi:PAS domain S-box-containing protein